MYPSLIYLNRIEIWVFRFQHFKITIESRYTWCWTAPIPQSTDCAVFRYLQIFNIRKMVESKSSAFFCTLDPLLALVSIERYRKRPVVRSYELFQAQSWCAVSELVLKQFLVTIGSFVVEAVGFLLYWLNVLRRSRIKFPREQSDYGKTRPGSKIQGPPLFGVFLHLLWGLCTRIKLDGERRLFTPQVFRANINHGGASRKNSQYLKNHI